jgi:hypothetical protein
MPLFSPKLVLDEGTTEWLFDAYAWALESFGTDMFFSHTELILPDDKFFPDKLEEADDVAETLFTRVREYVGMADWPCKLVAQEEDADPVVAPTVLIKGAPSGPAGTFSVGGQHNDVWITYNPSQLRRPESLISTFAHELAHYLAHSAENEPPGGHEFEEHATDLLAVFLGFGVFLANSAFSFQQFTDVDSQGWSMQRQGYLLEEQLTYALAIFLELKQIDRKEVETYLDKHLRKVLKKSVRELRRRTEDMDRLRAIQSYKISTPGL